MQIFTKFSQVVAFLNQHKDPLIAEVVLKTEQAMNKKDVLTKQIPNPNGLVYKESDVLLTLNAKYEQLVNFQREDEGKEADFKAQSTKAKYNYINESVSELNGGLYLRGVVQKWDTKRYVDANGADVDYTKIAPFIPKPSANKSQGVDNAIQYRTIKSEGIVSIKTNLFVYTPS